MAKKRKKTEYRHKKRLRLLYLMVSACLIAAALIAGCMVFFQVERVIAEGSTKYSEEQVLDAAAVGSKANLLLLPRSAIAARVKESLPYVDEVTVERVFPTTVRIVIDECVPTASIESDGIYWVIDEKGKILENIEASMVGNYIQISGVRLVNPEIGNYAEVSAEEATIFKGMCGILTALHERELTQNVTWIDLSDRLEIDMDYLGRFIVRLPVTTEYNEAKKRTEGYGMKIAALSEMIAYLDNEQGTIDLRSQSGRFIPR